MNGIDSLVLGHFGEVNKGYKQLICSLAKVAAESKKVGNIIPASSTDHKRKGAYALFKKRFKVALGCMAISTIYKKNKRSCNSGSMCWKYQRIPFRIWKLMVQ